MTHLPAGISDGQGRRKGDGDAGFPAVRSTIVAASPLGAEAFPPAAGCDSERDGRAYGTTAPSLRWVPMCEFLIRIVSEVLRLRIANSSGRSRRRVTAVCLAWVMALAWRRGKRRRRR